MKRNVYLIMIAVLLFTNGCFENKKIDTGKLIIKIFWPEQIVNIMKRKIPINTDKIEIELYKDQVIVDKKVVSRTTSALSTNIVFTDLKLGIYTLKCLAFAKTTIVAKGEKTIEIVAGENSDSIELIETNTNPSKPIVLTPVDRYVFKTNEGQISWEKSIDSDKDTVTYTIYKGISPTNLAVEAKNISLTEYKLLGLNDLTRYYYQIEADDGRGGLAKSEIMSFEIDQNYPVSIVEYPYTSKTAVTVSSSKINQSKINISSTILFQNIWDDFASNVSFTLSGDDGEKKIFVKYKDNGGAESGVYEISTILDRSKPIGSIKIKNFTTNSVIVSNVASDENGVDKATYSFDNINWTNWKQYTAEQALLFENGIKPNKIYAKFVDFAGNESNVFSAETTATSVSILTAIPIDGSKNFAPDYIEVTFNDEMDIATLTNENVFVSIGTTSGILVEGTISYANKKMKFTPKEPFPAGNVFNVTVKSNVAGIAGNNLKADYKWKFEVVVNNYYGSPAVDKNGNIYFGSVFGKVYSFDKLGNMRWSYKVSDGIYTTPVIYKENLYIPSKDQKLYSFALDSTTTSGSLKWSYNAGTPMYSMPAVNSSGILYQTTFEGKLLAIDTNSTGQIMPKWEHSLNTQPFYTGITTTTTNTIYLCAGSGLYSIDETNSNKREKWTQPFQTGSEIYHSRPLFDKNTIYVGSKDKKLYAVNVEGTKKWEFVTEGEVNSPPSVSGSTIYVGSNDQKVYAINQLDGVKKWEYKTTGAVYSKPLMTSEGAIIVGARDKNIYSLDANGNLLWKILLDDEICSSPCSTDGDIIVINTIKESLYAIKNNGSSAEILWQVNLAEIGSR